MSAPTVTYRVGHVLDVLRVMPEASVHCCVTSPPYWGLRSYAGAQEQIWDGAEGCEHQWSAEGRRHQGGGNGGGAATVGRDQSARDEVKEIRTGRFCDGCGAWRGGLGLEPSPLLYIEHMVQVFREVWRVLRPDGTLWLNLGDSYCGKGGTQTAYKGGLKEKDLVGMPWRVAFALQADGWWLRSDVVWSKPNPMPESVTDRPTKAHEYIFLLTKSERYFYDADAVREQPSDSTMARWKGRPYHKRQNEGYDPYFDFETKARQGHKGEQNMGVNEAGRNLRTVWTIPTKPFSDLGLDFTSADYVGDDGKPYKVSQDCPIHSPPGAPQTKRTGRDDGQQGHHTLRNPRNVPYPDGEHEALRASRSPRNNEANVGGISPPHILESMGGNKTQVEPTGADGLTSAEQTLSRTNHNGDASAPLLDNLDLRGRPCSPSANVRNIGNHKTDRAPSTMSPCIASARTTADKPGTLESLWNSGPSSHSRENNTSADGVEDVKENGPSAQTRLHTEGISSSNICTCRVNSLSHFATFPPELVEVCIKAGTSERGCCSATGAPWVREVEAKGGTIGKSWHDHADDLNAGMSQATTNATDFGKMHDGTYRRELRGWQPTCGVPVVREIDPPKEPEGLRNRGGDTKMAFHTWRILNPARTVGWRPSCNHGGEPVPCMVLDPFAGSGTTLAVARSLGRSSIGIDIAEEYRALATKRADLDIPPLSAFGAKP